MNMQLSRWQQDFIIKGFDDDLRIACCGISSGKSYAISIWIVLQCLKKPGIRGVVIAQTYRSLTLVLIREIRQRCIELGVPFEWNKGSNEITFPNGSILYAFSSENPDAILGLTEISLLAIDECAYCSEEIYNNARDRMRGGKYDSMVRLISSPCVVGKVANWFSAVVKKYPDKVVHATALDNPFTSEAFKNELKERYMEGTNLYRQQVLGEIFDTDIASQIIFRHEFPSIKVQSDSMNFAGVDCSGLGNDSDMYVVCDKFGVVDWKETKVADTFQKTDVLNSLYSMYKVNRVFIDNTGGYGQGLYDLSKQKGLNVNGINFAQKPYSEIYPNARTEMYLELANAIRHGFWVPDEAKEEILAQQVCINGRGQQQLIPKDKVKEILGHSPDLADAIALSVYAMNHSTVDIYDDRKADEIASKYLAYFNMGE